MSEQEQPRRLVNADVIRMQHELALAQSTRATSEPSATVEIDTTAKGDPKPRVHLYAPVDADLEALAAHVDALTQIALTAYHAATPAAVVLNEEVPF